MLAYKPEDTFQRGNWYWLMFVKGDKTANMSMEDFAEAAYIENPETNSEEIQKNLALLDLDGSGSLSWVEFKRVPAFFEKPPKDLLEKLKWYWDVFVAGDEMTFEEFFEGNQIENKDTPMEELKKYFDDLDLDKSGTLSK